MVLLLAIGALLVTGLWGEVIAQLRLHHRIQHPAVTLHLLAIPVPDLWKG